MDNLAHTLVGAAIGRAVADKHVPGAGWIGAVAANAPDWAEFLVGFRPSRGSAAYYGLHRGITHSLVGAAVESVAIAAVVWLLLAAWPRRREADRRPVPLAPVLWLVSAAVFSHVYMDWQNSYGLRPFLPWNARWYYGDFVAIVDPVFWVVPLVALAWGAERHWRDLIPFVLVFGFVVWLVLTVDDASGWLRVLVSATPVIGAIGWVRHWFGVAERRRAAALGLLLLAPYAGAQAIASAFPKRAAHRAAVLRFGVDAQSAALTRVGRPFQWEPILASPDTVAGPGWAIPRHLDDSQVRRALHDSAAGSLQRFARFLTAEVDSGPDGVVVTLRDARYARPPATGWGVVSVPLRPHGSR